MMRRASAKLPASVKVAAVALSLAVAGGAWRYGVTPPLTAPSAPRELEARAALEAREAFAPPPGDLPPLRAPDTSVSTETVAQTLPIELPAAPEESPRAPHVAVVTSPLAERPRGRRRNDASPARQRQRRATATKNAPPDEGVADGVSEESAADEGPTDDEVDFGIDEPPRIGRHSIRTTLD